jgi:hypothetical protein
MTDRIIAIGDVHGCSKALATLLEAIQPTQQDMLVFLGDYIDRGPDSRGVVEQVIALGERCTVVPLLGNHEEMMLAALESGQSEVRLWLKFGGEVALASYGWKGGPDVRPDELRSLIPRGHVAFLKSWRSKMGGGCGRQMRPGSYGSECGACHLPGGKTARGGSQRPGGNSSTACDRSSSTTTQTVARRSLALSRIVQDELCRKESGECLQEAPKGC